MRLLFGAGLNETGTPSVHEASTGQNFDLAMNRFSLVPRKPFDKKGTAPNAADVRGLIQLIKRSGVETTLVQAGATVYNWDGGTTWTSVGTVSTSSRLRDNYWSLDDYVVCTDLEKATVVKKWDGTSFSTLTTGLGTSLYAKYSVTHLGRVWMFNVKTSSDTPHLLVASAFENPTSYDTSKRAQDSSFTTGSEAFYMLTPDLRPINGVVLWLGDLVISTAGGRLYKLTGTNSKDFSFVDFYSRSNVVADEAIAAVGNDVVFVREGGIVESLMSTNRYGDVATDDLSRWIPTTAKTMTAPKVIYDQTGQRVLFFQDGEVVVLFKDVITAGATTSEAGEVSPLSPWGLYKTTHTSNFTTSVAKHMRRPGTKEYTTFFGDSSGNVYDLDGSNLTGDGGSAKILCSRKTKVIESPLNRIVRGRARYKRTAAVDFNINFDWADEYNSSLVTMTLSGRDETDAGYFNGSASYFNGDSYFSQGFDFTDRPSYQTFSAIGRAQAVVITVSAESYFQFEVLYVEL